MPYTSQYKPNTWYLLKFKAKENRSGMQDSDMSKICRSNNTTDCHRSVELTVWHCVSSWLRPRQMLFCQSSSESHSPATQKPKSSRYS